MEVTPLSLIVPNGTPGNGPNLQAAINQAKANSAAVWIPADYAGSDTYTNPSSVPVFDMRASGSTSFVSGTAAFGPNVIFPQSFGVKSDVKVGTDFTFTNTNTTVTSTSQITFTSADIGKTFFGTGCGPVGLQITSTVLVPVGHITAVNGHSATVSVAATASTGGATGCGFFGTDDTVAWQAAQTAALAVNGCPSIQMPGGMSFTTVGFFNAQGATCSPDLTLSGLDLGFSIMGQGQAVSIIIPLPNATATNNTGAEKVFDPTTCNGGLLARTCFFGAFSATVNDVGIWGGGNGSLGAGFTGAQHFAMAGNVGAQFTNVACAGWGGNTTNFVGIGTNSSRYSMTFEDGCGSIGVFSADNTGNKSYFYYLFAGDNHIRNFDGSGGDTVCFGCQFGITDSAGELVLLSGGQWRSFGNQAFLSSSAVTVAGLHCQSTATCYLNGDQWLISNNAGSFGLWCMNSATCYAVNSQFSGGATNGAILRQNTATFFDGGGNTQSVNFSTTILPTCSSTGLTQSACSTVTGSTNERGVIRVTAGGVGGAFTETLTFAGTFSGSTGQPPACSFTYSNTGTGTWASPTLLTITSASTSAVVIAGSATTVSSSTYDMAYVCQAK